MGSLQRYSGDRGYILEDEFLLQVKAYNFTLIIRIAKFLDSTISQVKHEDYEIQTLGCVIDDNPDNPFYFIVEVYKDDLDMVTIYNIEEVDLDYYLDLINSNSYLDERMG